MGNIFTYSAITTKIRAMQGELLKEADYREMATLTSVLEAVNFLKSRKKYTSAFSHVDIDTLHRSDFERLLQITKYKDFTSIYNFAGTSQRKFLNFYFIHYEISLLKRCLRCCIAHKPLDIDLSDSKDFYKRHSHLDFDAIIAAKTVDSLIETLNGSVFYDTLSKLSQNESATLFDYEVNMDLLYFKLMWKQKDKLLSKKEAKIIAETFGTRLDILNIQWIYRSKKYYNLPNTTIYSLLIPNYYKLKEAEIKALVETPDMENFDMVFDQTYYGRLGDKLFKEKPNLEALYAAVQDKTYQLSASRDPYSIATINTYLYNKEREIHKIITIIESIRYGLKTDEIIRDILKLDTRRTIA